ncbi:hypothetical protein KA082_00005 [Candidatus Woesebacteria bacterium]|nr:hypothetical protein [Candidatus Woesebacteria bacterium]
MNSRENPLPVESSEAYKDSAVIAAFSNTAWLTPEFIIAANTSPYPERHGLGSFKDDALRSFFETRTSPDSIFNRALIFISERMIGEQGHSFTLNNILFTDEKIAELAIREGSTEKHAFEREISPYIRQILLLLIAPIEIRTAVSRACLSWNDSYQKPRQDILLLSVLVKKGVQVFLAEELEKNSVPEIAENE